MSSTRRAMRDATRNKGPFSLENRRGLGRNLQSSFGSKKIVCGKAGAVIEWLEQGLGDIVGGWTIDVAGDPMPFQVLKSEYANGACSISTNGLGDACSSAAANLGDLRPELVLRVGRERDVGIAATLMQRLGLSYMRSGETIERGDLWGVDLGAGSHIYIYFTVPFFLAAEQREFNLNGDKYVAIWAVPISQAEYSAYIFGGWACLEASLEADAHIHFTGKRLTELLGHL